MPVFARGRRHRAAGGIPGANVAAQARPAPLTCFPHASGRTTAVRRRGRRPRLPQRPVRPHPVRYHEGRLPTLHVGPVRGTYPGARRRADTPSVSPTSPARTRHGRRPAAPFAYDAATPDRGGRRPRAAHPPGASSRTTARRSPWPAAGRRADLHRARRPAVRRDEQPGRRTARNAGPARSADVSASVSAPAGWVLTPRTPTTAARSRPATSSPPPTTSRRPARRRAPRTWWPTSPTAIPTAAPTPAGLAQRPGPPGRRHLPRARPGGHACRRDASTCPATSPSSAVGPGQGAR